jgi:hypothetical protein
LSEHVKLEGLQRHQALQEAVDGALTAMLRRSAQALFTLVSRNAAFNPLSKPCANAPPAGCW